MRFNNSRLRILTYIKKQHADKLDTADANEALKIGAVVGMYDRQIKKIIRNRIGKNRLKLVQVVMDFSKPPEKVKRLAVKRANRKKKVKRIKRKRNG